jgi:hypothetical protein
MKSHNDHTIESLVESEIDNELREYIFVCSEHMTMSDRGRGCNIR